MICDILIYAINLIKDKPVKVCESSPPLSPNLSSPSITATKSPSPNADISKSNKVDRFNYLIMYFVFCIYLSIC